MNKEGKKILSCKKEPYVCSMDDEKLRIFWNASQDIEGKKGYNQLGRVWKTEKYEWQRNVTKLASDEFERKFLAAECGLKTCLCVPYMVDEVLKGVIEFYGLEEWKEIPEIVEKVSYYANTSE